MLLKKKDYSQKPKVKKPLNPKLLKKTIVNYQTKKITILKHIFFADTLLADGISYKRVLININNSKQDVHIYK